MALSLLSQTAAAAEPTTTSAESAAPKPDSAPAPVAPAPAKTDAENQARDARLKALETQLASLTARLDEEQKTRAAAVPAAAAPAKPEHHDKPWYDSIKVSGYAQAQLEFHQDSEDQVATGGQPLNQNRFVLRRGRVKLESHHRYAEFLLELDGNTVRGPAFSLFRAELSAVYRGADASVDKAPLVGFSAGILLPPFGRELQESARVRPFMERSLLSRAFFPSEPDVGAKVAGTLGFFNYGVAVMNGEPAGQTAGFPLRDPNSAKDVIARLGVAADVSSVVKAAGGVSMITGTSTLRGTDGTKPLVTWTDANEDGVVTPIELSATPGSAPTQSRNFKHWALGADIDVGVKTPLGQTQLQAELVVADNLDRNLFISDPVTSGHDERQLGYYVAILQDITRHALVGFRYDYYDPRADVFGNKNGKFVPLKANVKTFSPLIGARLPGGLKLFGEWDIMRDHLATDVRGVPADRKNNAVTVRLQGEL